MDRYGFYAAPDDPLDTMRAHRPRVMDPLAPMQGEGPAEWWKRIKSVASKIPGFAKTASKLYGSDFATAIKNLIPSSDETGADSYPGERHAILKLPNGRMGMANFAGPGTKVLERVKRGDKPRTMVDKVAKAHDLRYALSGGDKAKVRDADLKMIAALNKIRKNKTDNAFNVNAALAVMGGKVGAEELGALEKGSFASDKPVSAEDSARLSAEMAKLEQEGFGDPQQALMNRLEKQLGKPKGASIKEVHGGLLDIGALAGDLILPKIFKFISKAVGKEVKVPKTLREMLKKKIREINTPTGQLDRAAKGMLPVILKGSGVDPKFLSKLEASKGVKHLKALLKPTIMAGMGAAQAGYGARQAGRGVTRAGATRMEGGAMKYLDDNLEGGSFWSWIKKTAKKFAKGFSYGFNKTKNFLKDTVGKLNIPVLSQAVNVVGKIPDIPGAADSWSGLMKQSRQIDHESK